MPTAKHNRRRIKPGARLPYWENARIDPRKLKDYALHPDKSKGKHKGFAALGYHQDDWQLLHDEILRRLPFSDATEADISNPVRISFTARITLRGPSGRHGVIVTGWCVDSGKEPWLTTLYAQPY
jgi:hypothetical protein